MANLLSVRRDAERGGRDDRAPQKNSDSAALYCGDMADKKMAGGAPGITCGGACAPGESDGEHPGRGYFGDGGAVLRKMGFALYYIMPDQAQKYRPAAPGSGGGGDGPSTPKVEKPNTEELLKRMRKVDPDQAKRYRQRTGQ